VGGAGSIDAGQRFVLASSVLPAWGEPSPPRLAPGGNGKGGSNALLPQANLSGENVSSLLQAEFAFWIVLPDKLATPRWPSPETGPSIGFGLAPV
jgi:hypothetical protein